MKFCIVDTRKLVSGFHRANPVGHWKFLLVNALTDLTHHRGALVVYNVLDFGITSFLSSRRRNSHNAKLV